MKIHPRSVTWPGRRTGDIPGLLGKLTFIQRGVITSKKKKKKKNITHTRAHTHQLSSSPWMDPWVPNAARYLNLARYSQQKRKTSFEGGNEYFGMGRDPVAQIFGKHDGIRGVLSVPGCCVTQLLSLCQPASQGDQPNVIVNSSRSFS